MDGSSSSLAVVGTYSDANEDGIYSYRLDRETDSLYELDATTGGVNPSFLAFHPNGKSLYAVNETDSGMLRSFDVDAETGTLTQTNVVDSGGAGPCHCNVVGEYVVVAHYVGGVVSLLPIGEGGRIKEPVDVVRHEGVSVHPERQTQPHPHSAVGSPDSRYVYVPDLGTDQIVSYQLDAEEGELQRSGAISLPDGSGPRHFTIAPGGNVAYVINELNSTIGMLDLDPKAGDLSLRGVVSTLPNNATDENIAADISLHPTGTWLYGSNRGHDSIVIFDVNEQGGLAVKSHEPVRGERPRNFAIDPTGKWLFTGNRRSDNIVMFTIDQNDGTLTAVGEKSIVQEPACMRFQ